MINIRRSGGKIWLFTVGKFLYYTLRSILYFKLKLDKLNMYIVHAKRLIKY